jgi:SNF2 family DNA or RNA helicase
VHSKLSAWAREQVEAEDTVGVLKDESRSVSLERLPRFAPKLHAAISERSYQLTGAAFMAIQGSVILGDDPGLGKTLQALGALIERDMQTILVACPRTATRTVWEAETRRWAPRIRVFVAQGSRTQREEAIAQFLKWPRKYKMLIINTEMVRAKRSEVCPDGYDPEECPLIADHGQRRGGKRHDHHYESFPDWPQLFDMHWDAIVMDESHMALASTYNIQSKHITQVRYGAMQLRRRVRKDGMAIAMSGTPARSRLTKLWGTLNWCRPDKFPSYWNFAGTHFGVEEGKHGMVVANGAKNPKPLDPKQFHLAVGPYLLQRDKAVVAPDLPPKFYTGTPPSDNPDGFVGVWLDMDPKQQRAYEEMKKMAAARVKGGEVTAVGVLAEITRLRQFADTYGRVDPKMVYRTIGLDKRGLVEEMEFSPSLPSSKLDWILEFLAEREEYESKIVIASSFTSVIEMFAELIEKEYGPIYQITGNTPDRERVRVVQNFNNPNDGVKVCMLNSRAGGVAITLDKCCDDLVFIDLPWTSDEATQVEDRIHRVSRMHNVQVHRLLCSGTVDGWMAENSDEQRAALLSARPDEMRERLLDELLSLWPKSAVEMAL